MLQLSGLRNLPKAESPIERSIALKSLNASVRKFFEAIELFTEGHEREVVTVLDDAIQKAKEASYYYPIKSKRVVTGAEHLRTVLRNRGLGRLAGENPQAAAIRAVYRQAKRYHLASLQDKDLLIAARHNGYATALIDVLRDFATEEEIAAVLGESAKAMRDQIILVQDKLETLTLKLLEQYKKLGGALPAI